MKKHKSLLPIILVLLALFIGTSLASGIFNNNREIEGELAENAGLNELNTEEVREQESEQIILDEEASDEDQAASNEILTADLEQQKDETEAAKNAKESEAEKTKPKDSAPQPAVKQMARVTVDGLNVRPDPSTNNERIDVLTQGQTVEVLAEQNNWLQVTLTDGRIGWISGVYVSRFSPSAGTGSLAGKVIAIDPGHGGTDPGAVGVSGLPEKEVVLDVSLQVANQLRAQGAEVILTRSTDVFIPLTQRVSIAHAAGADVFVSVHANAHPNPSIGGIETYYYRNKATSAASRYLATLMQRELVGTLQLRDIGVKDANFLVIRQTSMPSVLLELGFLSNAREESLMRTKEFREKAANSIVRALRDYFN